MDYMTASTDLGMAHGLLQIRWTRMRPVIAARVGCYVRVNEVYRSEQRQQWLAGAGRTVEQLALHGVPAEFARPAEAIVTHAFSAKTSAHGWIENGRPAAAAIDVVPVGKDGKSWTADDPWVEFVAAVAELGPGFGLIHFHAPGKTVWDKPHLQMSEWQDAPTFRLAL